MLRPLLEFLEAVAMAALRYVYIAHPSVGLRRLHLPFIGVVSSLRRVNKLLEVGEWTSFWLELLGGELRY